MRRHVAAAVLAVGIGMTAAPAMAAVSEQDLMKVAVDLSARYDSSYAAKDPAGMASVYAQDGVLVSPPGPIVRGRDALRAYYVKRFASGARGHAIKVLEVHALGDGGYGITRFSVTVPGPNGALHEEQGTIVAVYRHDPDGWHMAMVAPSVPEAAVQHGS